MKIVKSSFFLLSFFAICLSIGYAQGLEVSPVRFDFALEPGNSSAQTLTVRNTTNKRATYTLSSADWYLDETGTVVRQEAGENKFSCADWITFSPSLVELEANESKEVTISIDVPQNAQKTNWGLVYVSLKKEQEAPVADKDLAMGIEVNQAIGVFITQSPRSNRNASAKLSGFQEVDAESTENRSFVVRTENIGEKILNCNMYLVISDLENATEQKLEPVEFKVLPEGTILTTLALDKDLKKGSYLVAAVLDYGPENPLEGVQMQLDVR